MYPDAMSREMENCRTRIGELRRCLEIDTPAAEQKRALEVALAEVNTTLEELRVADDELRQQNEELTQAHLHLEVERERYRGLFDFAPDAYLVTDDAGAVLEANSVAAALLGLPRERLIGKPITVYIPTGDRVPFRAGLARASGGERLEGWEFDVLGRGREGLLPVEATVQRFDDGARILLRWTLRDVSERQRSRAALVTAYEHLEARVEERTRELHRANEALGAQLRERDALLRQLRDSEARLTERTVELARSNEDLQDFVYVASHDLKEPLRGISNYAKMVLEDCGGQLDAGGRDKLQTISRLAGRLHDLLDSLLVYARAGRLAMDLRETDLGAVAAEAVDSLGPWLAGPGGEPGSADGRARGRVEIGPLPAVVCDRLRIGEVFTNLLVNALKYNDSAEKLVEIGCRPASNTFSGSARMAEIFVRDNGIGIRPRHAETVFKMFRRLHPRDAYGGGMGAGLALVKKIIDRHNGAVWVEPTPDGQGGTTFIFTLPLAGEPEPCAGSSVRPES